jgi:hypothetical protein
MLSAVRAADIARQKRVTYIRMIYEQQHLIYAYNRILNLYQKNLKIYLIFTTAKNETFDTVRTGSYHHLQRPVIGYLLLVRTLIKVK